MTEDECWDQFWRAIARLDYLEAEVAGEPPEERAAA